MVGIFGNSSQSFHDVFEYVGTFMILFWLILLSVVRKYWETELAQKLLSKIKVEKGWSKTALKALTKSHEI